MHVFAKQLETKHKKKAVGITARAVKWLSLLFVCVCIVYDFLSIGDVYVFAKQLETKHTKKTVGITARAQAL